MARTVPVSLHVHKRRKGRLIPSNSTLRIFTSMSRPSIVPSIDQFRLPKFDFEPWSTRASVYSQGTSEDEKALIDFNKCMSESAEDWSSVGLSIH